MFVFDQEILLEILSTQQGVDLAGYGRPRDAFELPVNVPHWVSGYGGKYEMQHTHVPAGVMVAVGNLEGLDVADQDKLKAQLKEIDIYPMGHSGDFAGRDLGELREWFTSRSRVDNESNPQTPIANARQLTPENLGQVRYDDLGGYLADHMNILRNLDGSGTMVPADRAERVRIASALLDGLSKTVRYTRIDEPVTAYQIRGEMRIEKGHDSAISLNMVAESKILIVRCKDGECSISPLDISMVGKTYVTADGQPLGDRGSVELSYILAKAITIAHEKLPSEALSYLRVPALDLPKP